jgi:2-dehydro-3-deoxyphosphogluconate aldolase / (4S)-4-hydroxy-2-oxoglutarate aldolase
MSTIIQAGGLPHLIVGHAAEARDESDRMTRKLKAGDVGAILSRVPVLPVLTIERAGDAIPVATALVAGGLDVLEVTLRTGAALEAIASIASAVPEAVIGAGSVTDPENFAAAAQAGARFAVSPGATLELEHAAARAGLPWLPAAQSVSEVLLLRRRGFRTMKFFPAEQSGGTGFLRAIFGPVPDVRFCPTGGITAANTRSYLALPNVSCVGASWPASPALIADAKWDEIRKRARQASRMR